MTRGATGTVTGGDATETGADATGAAVTATGAAIAGRATTARRSSRPNPAQGSGERRRAAVSLEDVMEEMDGE